MMAGDPISREDKRRIARLENIDSVYVMLYLVEMYHTEFPLVFSKELVLAICWEESFFQNVAQYGGPAVGYGQLESSGRRIANEYRPNGPGGDANTDYPKTGEGRFNRTAILSSPATSIQAVSYCLAELYKRLKSKEAALNAYAGVRARPENAHIPKRWLNCAAALQKVWRDAADNPRGFNPLAFEEALRQARRFDTSGPIYEHIHRCLWPLLDTLSRLVDQVQIGSQGPQVTLVQDALNQLRPETPQSSLPLVLDGKFGPKTHASVKEFQTRNKLVVDGIVGPSTRQMLQRNAQNSAKA